MPGEFIISLQSWEHFFKPEVRHQAESFLAKGKVTSSQLSDTEIQIYVRGTTSFKVVLKSKSIANPILDVSCSCPASMKGQFCKHIWSALLKTQLSHPHFFEGKLQIEKQKNTTQATTQKLKISEDQLDKKIKYQEKQAEYRKEQYKIQSQRQKEFKKLKQNKTEKEIVSIPIQVAAALAYFKLNGFVFDSPYSINEINLAKKKLSRVFHPDVGGSHEEILQLNRNYEILVYHLKSIQQ